MKHINSYGVALRDPSQIPELREPLAKQSLLLKPGGQIVLFRSAREVLQSTNKEISIDEFMSRANEIDWSMHSPLWNNIFVLLGTKILTKEENYGQSTKLVKYLIGGKQAHGDIAFMTSLKAVWNQQRPDEQLPKPLY